MSRDINGFLRDSSGAPWDDLRIPLQSAKVTGIANIPTFAQFQDDGAGSVGVFAWSFVDDDQLFFTAQMPHDWKQGSTIWPHLHWSPSSDDASANNMGIALEYSWANIDSDFGNTSTVSIDASTGVNNANAHLVADFSATGIAGTGQLLSSLLVCRVYREAAAAGTNYPDAAWFHFVDFHYQRDSRGSRGIGTK